MVNGRRVRSFQGATAARLFAESDALERVDGTLLAYGTLPAPDSIADGDELIAAGFHVERFHPKQ
jgi:hypothetical protein